MIKYTLESRYQRKIMSPFLISYKFFMESEKMNLKMNDS